jgi:hypothetical protein
MLHSPELRLIHISFYIHALSGNSQTLLSCKVIICLLKNVLKCLHPVSLDRLGWFVPLLWKVRLRWRFEFIKTFIRRRHNLEAIRVACEILSFSLRAVNYRRQNFLTYRSSHHKSSFSKRLLGVNRLFYWDQAIARNHSYRVIVEEDEKVVLVLLLLSQNSIYRHRGCAALALFKSLFVLSKSLS